MELDLRRIVEARTDHLRNGVGSETNFGADGVRLVSGSAKPGENHLRNIRQLTNGGENAEAYFSDDGRAVHLPEHSGRKDVTSST